MSIYLTKVIFPTIEQRFRRTYPANVINSLGTEIFKLDTITILYGSNGSGKSTVLNLIAQKIQCQRETRFDHKPSYDFENGNLMSMFDEMVNKTKAFSPDGLPFVCKFITSAEVLNYVDQKLAHNNKLTNDIQRRADYMDSWQWQDTDGVINDGAAYLKKINEKRSWAQSIMQEKDIYSNGEETLSYFSERLERDGLYLLDEPENCLSPIFQKRLSNRILELVKNGRCQFIIATHSPFFLSLEGAKIFNLDKMPVTDDEKWHELANMQPYFELFNS